MSVYNDLMNNIYHTTGSRIVWSSTRRPALLLTDEAQTFVNFDVAFPDFTKSNCYGFAYNVDEFGFQFSSCVSLTSINPQEWDSGLSLVCAIPAGCNYFETEISLTRITVPSAFMDVAIPDVFGSNTRHMPDGSAAIVEAIGPLIRMFSFERSGNSIYLRRKQSVVDQGPVVGWNDPNDNVNPITFGYRAGWTYGGNPNAHPAYRIEAKNTGGIDKRRGSGNQCSLTDPSDYTSLWRGTVTITPGYIHDV